MTIAYLHDWPLDQLAANLVQVVHFCEALNSHEEVRLYAPAHQPDDIDGFLFSVLARSPAFDVRPFVRHPRLPARKRALAWYALSHARHQPARLWYTRSAQLGAAVARAGKLVVMELHVPPRLEGSRSHRYFQWLLDSGQLAAIVCITHALAKDIEQTYNLPDDVTLVVQPDGAAPAPTPPCVRDATAGGPIVYAGSFYPGKGLEMVVRLAREAPDLRFVALGGSMSDAAWLVAAESVPENLTMLGRLAHSDVRPVLQRAAVALAPMQAHAVGVGGDINLAPYASPLKLFEYFAAGVPVVASDLPGHREVLEHGVTGLLCPPADAEAWISGIRSLLDDREWAASIAGHAYAEFSERWSWDARADQIYDVLRRI